jgi:hypothetical protein
MNLASKLAAQSPFPPESIICNRPLSAREIFDPNSPKFVASSISKKFSSISPQFAPVADFLNPSGGRYAKVSSHCSCRAGAWRVSMGRKL